MASEEPQSPGTPPQSGPGTHPSGSNYASDLPLAEDLQMLLRGKYIVEGFLGQGGMGAVYQGLQMPLKRPVAIKILRKRTAASGEDDFAFEERFKREAYAMASLTHPHIVQVYDCGDAGETFLFISMELVDGGDLSHAIKAGLTPEAALKLIPQICDGLQAAHDRGIVHRDIKPANIFLTKDGRAKVADFGLAKKFDAKNTLVTKAGFGMGTPDYAAPEQYDGVEDLDHRADIYSFGVMIYQMLTGKLPRGATFKPPSQLVGVDPRIDAVVKKAMESEREDRYQSVGEIKAALAQIAGQSRAVATATPDTHTSAVPVVVRPPTGTHATTGGRPATSGRPASQPTHRPTTKAVPIAEPEKKKPNLVVIGSIAAVVVLGVGALFALKKTPTLPAAPEGRSSTSATAIPKEKMSGGGSAVSSPAVSTALSPGKWVKLDWSKMNLKDGEVRGDTLILPADAQVVLPGLEMTNAVVRVRVRRPGGEPRGVQIRQRNQSGFTTYAFAAIPSEGALQGMLQVSTGPGNDTKTTRTVPFRTLEPDKECDMMFSAIGDQYILVADNRTLVMHRDDRLVKPGGAGLWAGRGTTEFRGLEVLLLDGLTEDQYPDFVKDSLAKARGNAPATVAAPAAPIKAAKVPDPAKWQPTTAGNAFVKSGDATVNGGVIEIKTGNYRSTREFRDSAARGRIAVKTREEIAGIGLRDNPLGNYSALLLGTGKVVIQRADAVPERKYTSLKVFETPQFSRLETLREMVFSAVGNVLTVWVDGQELGSVTDDKFAAGRIQFSSRGATYRDTAFQSLDETTGMTTAQSPTGNAANPSMEFPPGQWVKVFTKSEDFSPGALKPGGITFQDGWIVPPEKSGTSIKTLLTSKAQGIRARFLRSNKIGKFDLLNGTEGDTWHTTGFQIAGNAGIYAVDGPQGLPQPRIAALDFGKVPRPAPGEEYSMEFYAVGGLLVGRSGGALVSVANPVSKPGSPSVYIDGEKVRDIEVINLEGISDAEALAIAGVDDKGNDVRAIAAAREKQEREAKAQADAISSVPELKTLHEQFVKLKEERITAPFQADVANLNAGYLSAVDRAMTEEKAAGRADAVLALEGEKKLIGDRQAMPAEDDDALPAALKKLRGIYRASHGKLEAERVAKLKALTEPLVMRLTALEVELTKKDRIPDAKTVREYRDRIPGGTSNDPAPPDAGAISTAKLNGEDKPIVDSKPEPAAPNVRVKPDADLSRKAAEYALSKGAKVTLGVSGKEVQIAPDESLPKGSWELWRVIYPLAGDLSDEDVQSATQAVELKHFHSSEQGKSSVTSLVPFKNTPRIEIISMTGYRAVGPEDCAVLSRLPLLVDLRLQNVRSMDNLGTLIGGLNLKRFEMSGVTLSAEDCAAICKQTALTWLNLGRTATDDTIGRLGGLSVLERLYAPFANVTGASLQNLNPKLEKTLKVLAVGSDAQDSSTTMAVALARFPLLDDLQIRGEINATSFERLPKLEHLKKLVCLQATVSSQHAELIGQCDSLEELRLGAGQLTGSEVSALKRLKNLKTLTVQDNGIRISEDALRALAALKVTKLELPESQVTGDQAEALRKQMPKCAISLVKAYR